LCCSLASDSLEKPGDELLIADAHRHERLAATDAVRVPPAPVQVARVIRRFE
jgi:hypothetical protein